MGKFNREMIIGFAKERILTKKVAVSVGVAIAAVIAAVVVVKHQDDIELPAQPPFEG